MEEKYGLPFCFSWVQSCTEKSCAVADPDLLIRGDRSSRPWDKGGPGLKKNCFWPFGPQFDLKIRRPRPPGPSPGSATDTCQFFVFSYHICNTTGCCDPEILLQPWQRDVTTSPPLLVHSVSHANLKTVRLRYPNGHFLSVISNSALPLEEASSFLVFSQLQTKVNLRLKPESQLKRGLKIRWVQYKIYKNNQLCCFLSQEMYKAMRVCVIGAGPSGMSALYQFKQLEMKGQEIPEIVCFEKQSDWGGLWNYSWRTGKRWFCCIRITAENSPNPSPVYIRLCKYRKKVFYCFMKTLSREKTQNALLWHWLKLDIVTSRELLYTTYCKRNLVLQKRGFPRYRFFSSLKMSA